MRSFLFSFSIIVLACFIHSAVAQSNYIPPKSDSVSIEDYQKGKYILEYSRSQIKGETLAIDYLNFAMAYLFMAQSKDSILYFMHRAKATSKKDFCELIKSIFPTEEKINNSTLYKKLGDSFKDLFRDCDALSVEEEKIDIKQYAESNKYNLALIQDLDRIKTLDQKHRSPYDSSLQKPIDRQNQKDVEKILKKWGYPGQDLVGDRYNSVCWLVIQHSELSYQEKYLSMIHTAVVKEQLPEICLRMLLDRIFMKKTNTQIFGSQANVRIADEKTIQEVKRKYGLK